MSNRISFDLAGSVPGMSVYKNPTNKMSLIIGGNGQSCIISTDSLAEYMCKYGGTVNLPHLRVTENNHLAVIAKEVKSRMDDVGRLAQSLAEGLPFNKLSEDDKSLISQSLGLLVVQFSTDADDYDEEDLNHED